MELKLFRTSPGNAVPLFLFTGVGCVLPDLATVTLGMVVGVDDRLS